MELEPSQIHTKHVSPIGSTQPDHSVWLYESITAVLLNPSRPNMLVKSMSVRIYFTQLAPQLAKQSERADWSGD